MLTASCAPSQSKPVSNDFNAALILPGGINIEISKPASWQMRAATREGRLTEDILQGGRRKGSAVAGSGNALQSRAEAGGAGGEAERQAEGQLRRKPVLW